MGEDVSRLIRALAVDFPPKYEDAMLAAVEAVCAGGKPVEFERFGGCVRVAITNRFLFREARELWSTLEPGDDHATIAADVLLRALPPFQGEKTPRSPEGPDDGPQSHSIPACLEPKTLRDALQHLPRPGGRLLEERGVAVDTTNKDGR